MPKAKEPKVPLRVRRLVMACEGGQKLCLTIRRSEVGDDKLYWLEPSGRPVGVKSAEQAMTLGLLRPSGDGLFGSSQTWMAAT